MTVIGAPLVRCEGISCGYGPKPVIVDVTMTVNAGDFIGILGPSGAGKTTLLQAILGMNAPLAGRVVKRPDVRIGYVPQRETVDWTFPITVEEVLLMCCRRAWRIPWFSHAERDLAGDVLNRLGIGGLAHRQIGELSGGQQQRVFLARALLERPSLLVLDEPTSGLDISMRMDILCQLRELNRTGVAILLSTHDLNGVAAQLPSLICINRTITATGSPWKVLTSHVLERTYGSPMSVIVHHGRPLAVERTLWDDRETRPSVIVERGDPEDAFDCRAVPI